MATSSDHDFNWLEAVHESFLVRQFNALKQDVHRLVDCRNKFLSSAEYREIFPDSSMRFQCRSQAEDVFDVLRIRNEASRLELVKFTLQRYEKRIRVFGTGIDPELHIWTDSTSTGEFFFKLRPEDTEATTTTNLKRWQVLKMVLGNFLVGKFGVSELA